MIFAGVPLPDFLWRAAACGLGIALMAGPLGCFVVWRRMAYFGETLAHSALLGVVLSFALHLPPTLAIVATACATAMILALLQRNSRFSADTLLGILAHGTLSVGLAGIAFMKQVRVDLSAFLFGDILAIGASDIATIYSVATLVLALLALYWRTLVMMTLHEDMARVQGLRVDAARMLLMLMIALVVAVSIKLVGMLLITALLVIPAATARYLARSTFGMAATAAVAGCMAIVFGLAASWRYDAPSGPSIVVAALMLFLMAFLLRGVRSPQ